MKLTIFTICLLAFLFAFSTQTFAVDFTVNLTTDQHDANLADGICAIAGGDCTLRAAVEQANALASNDRILFNLPANSTITLISPVNNEDIPVTNNGTLEIAGTGANNLTIDGGAGYNRIFYINGATVIISGVTLTGGNGWGQNSDSGGAIYTGSGGAIYTTIGSLTLDGVHVTGNSVGSAGGGGVFYLAGTHRIINSSFSGNFSGGGGGFYNYGGTLTVVNSTISGNRVQVQSGGGGFTNFDGNTTLRNVTITNNTASSLGGGGIFNNGTLNFGNTIVAGNTTPGGFAPEVYFPGGTITSAGGNLVGDSPGDSANTLNPVFYHPTDIRDVNPLLGALQNNGGTAPTHALLAGSPAVDAGLNALAIDPFNGTALAFDQRGVGFPRIRDGNGDGTAIVDIGTFEVQLGSTAAKTLFDFDGDGKADISVFRPSNGYWYIMKSSGGFSSIQWGQASDRPAPGDYDGDGKTDLAVYRNGVLQNLGDIANNNWYILRSSDNTFRAREWGTTAFERFDTPVPADYDGDGKTDLAVYTSSGNPGEPIPFTILQSSTNTEVIRQWGTNGDKVVPADYDGDGKADLAVSRYFVGSSNTANIWYILQSSNGEVRVERFGLPTDRLVPADYDGDGKADIAVWRPSNGFWYRLNSSDGSFHAQQFGVAEDKPVPADYDGDGKTDIAVFRPSNGTWYLQRSTEGFAAQQFGLSTDIPIPNVYVR